MRDWLSAVAVRGGRRMERERSLWSALAIFFLLLAMLGAAWIYIGPGALVVTLASDQASSLLTSVAAWYRSKVAGSAKLVEPIITIASGVYAITKALMYAERNLHRRLSDFLGREETRLNDARRQLRLKLERPGPARPFESPVFSSEPLHQSVRELGWGSYFLPPQLGFAEFQLGSAIDKLERQVNLSEGHHQHLQRELATALLLKGAMFAAQGATARHANADDRFYVNSALHCFEGALVINRDDVEALEYASHMLVILDREQEAGIHLEKILALTSGNAKSLPRARALRYKATIAKNRKPPNNVIARNHLKDALKVLPNLQGDDWIEEAELHEQLGDVQKTLNARKKARAHWDIAKAVYDRIKTTESTEGAARVLGKLNALQLPPDCQDDSDDDEAPTVAAPN